MEKIQAEKAGKEELSYDTKLKEKFNQTLEREKEKGELPPVSIDIFYSIHKTKEDIKKLAERFKKWRLSLDNK